MRRAHAVTGSTVFFLLAPGTVAALVPWWITGWRMLSPLPSWAMLPLRVVGVLLILAGLPVLAGAFVRFVVEGLGTPAPVAAPEKLVVGGFYRYVRNPMYVAVFAIILGQAALLGQGSLVVYAAVVAVPVYLFVRFYEEPTLRARFGGDYDAYRAQVPSWWPRWRPARR
ncbi:methyltransferase family protein [Nonomuraea soli]|uniref:Protein-S-isoprenylcysteine O-methyltransferase Ste14 n=1 Tax=Nonomuraea soli TaxID=1032476 RepID=A0A7W0HNJ1_9ACTN|nr:isoprenylcysteine carboxylmethyltransferase family protein [Nonomuraea soli]MBA2889838.1 protein-S-isoprenylcysteine O-methyltransferase Ste14 [Nonomuraea soli]